MARTAYCKRCGKEVEAGEMCPFCGTRLGKSAAHAAWCVERTPVKDWMYWNSVMRLLLPGTLVIAVLVLLAELIAGGFGAVEKMLSSAFPMVLGILLLTVLAVTFAILLMQGKELSDFVVDNRGVHETRYLPNPTPLKLILRLKAPQMPAEGQVLEISSRQIAWKDIARVQLWPEKCMVLFYAPSWWLRIPVVCTPFTWDDTLEYIREKLGKKKKVRLPGSLVVQSQTEASRLRTKATQSFTYPDVMQISMDDLPGTEEPPTEPEGPENGADPLP